MTPTIFIKFCGFIGHSNLNNMNLSAIPGKISETKKKSFFFLFYPTLKIKDSLPKKQANELSDKHGILQTYSIVSLAMLLNHRRDRQESIAIGHLKCTANRNKSFPN